MNIRIFSLFGKLFKLFRGKLKFNAISTISLSCSRSVTHDVFNRLWRLSFTPLATNPMYKKLSSSYNAARLIQERQGRHCLMSFVSVRATVEIFFAQYDLPAELAKVLLTTLLVFVVFKVEIPATKDYPKKSNCMISGLK